MRELFEVLRGYQIVAFCLLVLHSIWCYPRLMPFIVYVNCTPIPSRITISKPNLNL